MITRNMINNNVVWFNSQGVTTLTEGQRIELTTDDTSITGSVVNQEFNLMFNALDDVTIQLLDSEDNILDSITVEPGNDYNFIGKLTGELSTINVGDISKVENAVFILRPITESIKAENYVGESKGVSVSLTQRLSIIRRELWYNINYGLPLLEKIKSKALIDSTVLSIITNHPEVIGIESFESKIIDKNYTATAKINTIYGGITISI